MKHRILFVDDEPRVLEGLKRMLRSMRHEWGMEFKGNGQEALAFLEHTEVDVVVSDVRMPGMNGVQLLKEIQCLYPHTIRILLSGQSDEKMTLAAIGPVHQYLAKPCEADILKATIARSCVLGTLLDNEQVRRLVSQVEFLPTLPDLYLELEQELQSSECSIERVATIMGKDVGMMAQVLKLVNSAFFGIQQHISDPKQAVLFLGTATLKTLVLSFQVFQKLEAPQNFGFDQDRFCRHSLATGELARKIMVAEKADVQMVEETLAAAMLHDVGVLLMVSYFPDRYQESMALAQEQNIPLHEAEHQTINTTHAEVGAYLLGLWGLTTPIIEAVAFHHTPLGSPYHQFSPLTAVHVATILMSEGKDGLLAKSVANNMSMEYLEQVGLVDRVPYWQNLIDVPV